MNKLVNRLPEILATFVFAMGMYSVISKSVANAVVGDFSVDYLGAFIYIGVALGTFAVLKAIQTIVNELFNNNK